MAAEELSNYKYYSKGPLLELSEQKHIINLMRLASKRSGSSVFEFLVDFERMPIYFDHQPLYLTNSMT